jgi:hypothetical protein
MHLRCCIPRPHYMIRVYKYVVGHLITVLDRPIVESSPHFHSYLLATRPHDVPLTDLQNTRNCRYRITL